MRYTVLRSFALSVDSSVISIFDRFPFFCVQTSREYANLFIASPCKFTYLMRRHNSYLVSAVFFNIPVYFGMKKLEHFVYVERRKQNEFNHFSDIFLGHSHQSSCKQAGELRILMKYVHIENSHSNDVQTNLHTVLVCDDIPHLYSVWCGCLRQCRIYVVQMRQKTAASRPGTALGRICCCRLFMIFQFFSRSSRYLVLSLVFNIIIEHVPQKVSTNL